MRISDWSSDVCSSDLRVDDALHATRAAVEEGIVPGGGTALLYATRAIEGLKGVNDDQTRGIDSVRKSLTSLVRQIASNAGHDGAVVWGSSEERRGGRAGVRTWSSRWSAYPYNTIKDKERARTQVRLNSER